MLYTFPPNGHHLGPEQLTYFHPIAGGHVVDDNVIFRSSEIPQLKPHRLLNAQLALFNLGYNTTLLKFALYANKYMRCTV